MTPITFTLLVLWEYQVTVKFGASSYLILANQYLDQNFILDVVQGHEDEPLLTVYTFGSSLKTRPLLVRGLFFLLANFP